MPEATNPGPDRRRLISLVVVLGIGVLVGVPPFGWLPPTSDARSLLGVLVGAQATIAALTLAVSVFVLQVVGARRDAEERVYEEYRHRSGVDYIFPGSILAVSTTAAALLAEVLVGEGSPLLRAAPGLHNLTSLALYALLANLALAVTLYWKGIRLAAPDEWRRLRREVDERDVREAVQVFLHRLGQATRSLETDEPSLADAFPDPGEGFADNAIRALLDQARRAMNDRQQTDFTRALDSIKGLITHAMDTIEGEDLAWGPPGSQPQWPPLRQLGRSLYTFREEIIGQGDREHSFALTSLDYWLLSTGVRRRCGELFTVGLDGYCRNYEIARRVGSDDLREMFRDRAWTTLPWLLADMTSEDGFPYVEHAVRQQERLLSDAMHNQDAADFGSLMGGFSDLFRHIRFSWGVSTRWPRSESANQYEDLQQAYRIALMGLGGRAMSLTESERVADAGPYLAAIRGADVDVQQMAADIAQALVHHEGEWSLWSDWEMEGAENTEPRWIRTERYALSFFSVRLLELARDPMPPLDFDGRAQQVLDWLDEHIDRLERHVQLEPEASVEERRERARDALRAAVSRDEVAADEEIIRRELSEERIAAFTADVYASALSNNAIERLFARAGAFEYLASAADRGPEERGASQYVSKGFLATEPENARTHYGQLPGDEWGGSHADDVVAMLREALGEAPTIEAPLDSEQDLLSAIDAAVDGLGPDGGVILLVTGDWSRITFDLAINPPDGYEPRWGGQPVHAREQGVEARYHGHPIIWDRTDGERRLYVVEPGTWGCFVRQQAEGDTDLLVEVEPIPEERAREMLSENPNHLPDIDDHDVKLRKLQTFVRVAVAARTGFRITNPDRARRVVPPASA